MEGVLKLKAEYPDARLVVGNTEVGIEMKFKDARYPVLIGVTHVPELNHTQVCGCWVMLALSVEHHLGCSLEWLLHCVYPMF